jgi:hypothetical protein
MEEKTKQTPKSLAYEKDVRSVCEKVSENFPKLSVLEDVGGGFSSAGSGDLTLKINGQKYYIEIKMNKKAQMGGTSVRYRSSLPKEERFSFLKSEGIESEMIDIYRAVLNSKSDAIEKLIGELKASYPFEVHQNIEGFPMVVGKEAWSIATSRGLIKPINAFIEENASFIRNHYLSKGVDYIQIGGCGLFHTGKNPLHLPVPLLNGNIRVEIRAGASGSKPSRYGLVRGVGLRVQGRIQFSMVQMEHTLDDYESAVKTLSHLIK